jgi:signal transduction histidine kinase
VYIEKERLEGEAKRRARLAEIGQVIAGSAHCTKNIIHSLRMSIDMLRRALDRKQYDEAAKALRHITEQEQRISTLVLDMLNYSADRQPVRKPVEMHALIEKLLAPCRQGAEEKGIAIELIAAPETPVIQADEFALQRLFLNLVVNALDALGTRKDGGGKRLRVTVAPCPERHAVEVRVHDTGCGIASENMARLFNPFFTTKGGAGTGLGLAVVQKIVWEHGGEIAVDSIAGEWTEFRVLLPVGDAASG